MLLMRPRLGWFLMLALAVTGIGVSGSEGRLLDAAKMADWPVLRDLVEQGEDVTLAQADGTTALHWAGYWNSVETADVLIRAGAEVNQGNDLGVTPLWTACENGSPPMVRRLLQAGADPNAALPSGETLLMTAARTGSVDVVRQLLVAGAEPNAKEHAHGRQTALMWAVSERHPAVVDVLLEHGADVEARSEVWNKRVKTTTEQGNGYITDIPEGGYTPLLFAARVGAHESAKLLLDAGADVNDTAPYGTSATVVAAHSGHGRLASYLLERGADPDAAEAGYTALHVAIVRRDEALVAALLSHGADPNIPLAASTPARRQSIDVYLLPAHVGATPFWLAARYSAAGIMRLLAEHGADPRAVHHLDYLRQGRGYTVVRVVEGDTNTLMAAAGMGGRLRFRDGQDPLEIEARMLEAVKVAVELGVDVNAADADGNTALHNVATLGYDTVMQFLLEHGANPDATNRGGQNPFAQANSRGR